eukprot:152871-Chlamydomonas_euryale.AAC.1
MVMHQPVARPATPPPLEHVPLRMDGDAQMHQPVARRLRAALTQALIAWLVMPQTRGASMLYTRYLRPALRRFRPKIDVCTEKLCEGGAAVYTMYKVWERPVTRHTIVARGPPHSTPLGGLKCRPRTPAQLSAPRRVIHGSATTGLYWAPPHAPRMAGSQAAY